MKTKILLLFSVVAFLAACKSNENPNISITNADIIGTWNLTSQEITDGTMVFTVQGETISISYSQLSKDIDMTYSFSDTPKILTIQGKQTSQTTTSFLGETSIEEENIDTDIEPIEDATWELNSNGTITITEDNQPFSILTIKEFSGNYLKLTAEINETATDTDSQESITFSAMMSIVLEK